MGGAEFSAVRELRASDAGYQCSACCAATRPGRWSPAAASVHDGMAFGGYLAELDGEPAGVAMRAPRGR